MRKVMAIWAALAALALSAPAWSEVTDRDRALIRATAAFFQSVEQRDHARSLDFFAEAYATAVPLDQWQNERLRQLVDKGPLKNLTAYRITWYPIDTLLGSVDFVGRDPRDGRLVCGFVLWEFPERAEPKLRLYEATRLDPGTLSRMPPGEAGAQLLEANCAFTSIEANFALSAR